MNVGGNQVVLCRSKREKKKLQHSQGIKLIVRVFRDKSAGLPVRGIKHETP